MATQFDESPVHEPRTADGTASILPAANGSRLLTRQEAARLLGVSETTLRRREAEGLRPTMRGRTHMYEETLVRQMTTTMRRRWTAAAPSDGGTAADVFALLAEGVEPRDIVIRLRIPPEVVGRLCAQWAELGESLFVSGEEARALGLRTLEDLRAAVQRTSELSSAATRSTASEGTCRNCGVLVTSFCRDCYAIAQRAAFSFGITGKIARVERRIGVDGSPEARLLLEDCDVQNQATKNSMGGCALTTEWEPAGGRFHWSWAFSDGDAATAPLDE